MSRRNTVPTPCLSTRAVHRCAVARIHGENLERTDENESIPPSTLEGSASCSASVMSHTLCGSPTVTSVIVVIAVVVYATPSRAGSQDLSPTRHVRARDARIGALIEDGARRSPLFRSLLEMIEQSSAIVYVESRMLPAALARQLTLAGSGGPWRYVRIEIECRRSLDSQIATLGHELQHAVKLPRRERSWTSISRHCTENRLRHRSSPAAVRKPCGARGRGSSAPGALVACHRDLQSLIGVVLRARRNPKSL